MRWVPVTSQNRIEQVASGKVDLECGTTTVTLGRQERVDFSLITFLDGGAFLARGAQGSGPRTPRDIGSARVGGERRHDHREGAAPAGGRERHRRRGGGRCRTTSKASTS